MELSREVRELGEECARIRSALHRIPELAFQEYKTQRFILDYLEKLQPDVLQPLAGTGVKAVFLAPDAADTVALRADMDALPVSEDTGAAWQSEHEGVMHACGHDGHMTVLLLFCALAARHRRELRHNIVALFQPGEEGGAGACRMVEAGALRDPVPDRIYALHMCPDVPCGMVGLHHGNVCARSTGMDVTILGKSAHGSAPESGIDAVVAAAEYVLGVQSIVSRSTAARDALVISIGSLHAGTKRNIIADRAHLQLSIRSFDERVFDTARDALERLLRGLEVARGVQGKLEDVYDYPKVYNDPALTETFEQLFAPGECVSLEPFATGEDYSFYLQKLPGLMFWLGAGDESDVMQLHSPHFIFPHEALLSGVEVYRRLLL